MATKNFVPKKSHLMLKLMNKRYHKKNIKQFSLFTVFATYKKKKITQASTIAFDAVSIYYQIIPPSQIVASASLFEPFKQLSIFYNL